MYIYYIHPLYICIHITLLYAVVRRRQGGDRFQVSSFAAEHAQGEESVDASRISSLSI